MINIGDDRQGQSSCENYADLDLKGHRKTLNPRRQRLEKQNHLCDVELLHGGPDESGPQAFNFCVSVQKIQYKAMKE